MGEVEKYLGRRLDGGNVIPVLSAGISPAAVGVNTVQLGFNIDADRVHKFGQIPSIDSGSEPADIWDGGGIYPGFIPTWGTVILSSTSAEDDASPAGTGAWTVEIQGINAFGFATTEVQIMNGMGNVSNGNMHRVFRMKVLTAGTHFTNVGTITATIGGVTVAQILPDNGQTLMAVYTVPADYKQAWLMQYSASLAANAATARSAQIQLQMRPFGGAWNVKETLELHSYGGLAVQPYPLPIAIGAKTDIRWRVTDVSAASTLINATFDLYLEPQDPAV